MSEIRQYSYSQYLTDEAAEQNIQQPALLVGMMTLELTAQAQREGKTIDWETYSINAERNEQILATVFIARARSTA